MEELQERGWGLLRLWSSQRMLERISPMDNLMIELGPGRGSLLGTTVVLDEEFGLRRNLLRYSLRERWPRMKTC